jgi:hypothetical protein
MRWRSNWTLLALCVLVPLVGAALFWTFAVRDYTGGGPEHACQVEAETFQTAVDAYTTHAHTHRSGATLADVTTVLGTAKAGGPYLQPAKLRFADASLPPARAKWAYDIAHANVVEGDGCTT